MKPLMNVRTFVRGGYLSATEPVQIIRGTEILGEWTPFGAWVDDKFIPGWPSGQPPASRSGPVIPSEDPAVGTRETDQAQIGAPEAIGTDGAADPVVREREAPVPHEPGGAQAPSGSSPASPTAVADLMRPVIVDPHFNSRGSRPAPRTGGQK